ncbi:putative MFS-type transporter YdgK [Paenibacillus larvae subsp. larvae]|uniref:Bcr/CflA family efflux transporter n=1 Tax=Paenibacillus larvae subsp. larvae TaxID=147375 RepID=A0A2L1U6Z4_9BACL|nr:multidrug effflux MFS transporter [Paenibacillus larvae]AQT84925.1 MFS transporter [Paenibacillus larvae subsp. pulvifaciens]AQZ46927.1 MFS transporter [Paenibacillus larvae subsp. pulvifaciens]AVF28696.1 putative MFS-type transporter YdgK [Paenibacillus larvae subsp. larvae]AVF33202.1 putative MFS-type transporter YdgK [Paenibacillus larvae subsp. larvae]MBH0343038.1 MFS transporter [Paenibacillus larvae]
MNPSTNPVNTSFAVTRKKRISMAIVLGSMTAIGPLSIDMYLPSLPILANDLGTSTSLAQLSLTACLLGLAIGQLLLGPLSDSRGRRGPLLISLLIYAAASFLCGLVPSIWGLILLRFIQGMAGSGGIVIARAMVRDMYSGTELTQFFSLLMLINGLAPILAPVAGGQLLQFTSWHGVFAVLGILGLVMVLAAFIGLQETLPREGRSKGGIKTTVGTFGRLLGDKVFMGYACTQGFVFAAMFSYISGSPFVLQDIYGASPQQFSLVFALNGLGLIIATQLTGRLAPRFHESRLFISGILLSLIGALLLLAMILIGAPLFAVLIFLFIVVSSTGIVNTVGFSLAMQNQGKNAGSASAMLGLLPFVAGSVAAPLVGIAGNHTAVPMGIVIVCCGLGAISCYMFMIRPQSSLGEEGRN